MHSWRTLILPFLDEKGLYDKYNFNEPWNGPNNKKLLASRPEGYACLSDKAVWLRGACTSYLAVVGSDAAWPGAKPKRLAKDPKTIVLVEAVNTGIQWSEPRDVSVDSLLAGRTHPMATVSSMHRTHDDDYFTYLYDPGAHVVLADGNVKFLAQRFARIRQVSKYA